MKCRYCHADAPDDSAFCPSCGAGMARKRKRIILPIIAGVVALAFIIGLWTNWFGLYGPGTKIITAVGRTLESETFTVEMTVDNNTIVYQVCLDFDREELTVAGFNQKDALVLAIYDGYLILDLGNYQAFDISKSIENFFECYDSAWDLDLEEFLLELDESLFDEINEMVYLDEMEKSLTSLFFKINNNAWLKENAGYSQARVDGMTVYTFEPDVYDLSQKVMEEFEDDFRHEDDYDALMDQLRTHRRTLRQVSLSVSFGVKRGRLVHMECNADGPEFSHSIVADITDIGSTHIDKDQLNDILNEATIP